MSKRSSSKTAVWILCALFVLVAVVASAAPAVSVKAQTSIQQGPILTDTWAVQVSPATDPNQLALQLGAQNLGQIGSLTGYYLFRIPGSTSQAAATSDIFAASSQVLWFQQQLARQQTKRDPIDPLYSSQWHLGDINVQAAWNAGYTGTGVTIAVVDDGLQYTHPDLSAQYNAAASWDFNGNDSSPLPTTLDRHGTAVAGVAAANNDDVSCGVGVAYDAGLAGIRLISGPVTDAQEAAALNYAWNTNYIYNNSWGPADDMTEPLVGPEPLTLAALQNGVTSGRNGKGSIYVWAAGNGLQALDNVNYDGYANSRFTIAVGAVDNSGVHTNYSEPGAAMLVTAPSGGGKGSGLPGITTTDLMGADGYNTASGTAGNCVTDFGSMAESDPAAPLGGTSSSAPIVSGVVALMLDANPNLGWRDVQEILARTAYQNDPTDPDWVTNGAGLHVNHKYGFGLVDAGAAVTMASTWVNLPKVVSLPTGTILVNQAVPDKDFDPSGIGVTSNFVVSQNIKNLEHVEVIFKSSLNPSSLTGGFRGDLKVVLTSPAGTQSVLADVHGDGATDYPSWKFMTVRDWGESSRGTWTLKVVDEAGGGESIFNSWELVLYGTGVTVSFADVPISAFAWAQIESIYAAGITGGCGLGPLIYCPNNPVTRAQMAVFLLKAIHGSSYTPPAVGTSTGFADVPVGYWAASWIKQLYAEGITAGCSSVSYCPDAIVTRAQMAIFLLRSKYGITYSPPAATGTAFGDVPSPAFAAAWIEKLVAEGITAGCGAGNYCPDNPVTRAQMAIFLQRTFNLPLP